MKKQLGSLKYLGVDLDIEYYYEPHSRGCLWESSGDVGSPDEGGEFYLESVEVNGVNIFSMLTEDILESISLQYTQENEL